MTKVFHLCDHFNDEHLPIATPLEQGVSVLEASAGTGKTFSLAGLVLRKIVEQDAQINRMLIITFTNAAASELRSRIGERIEEAHRYCLQLIRSLKNEESNSNANSLKPDNLLLHCFGSLNFPLFDITELQKREQRLHKARVSLNEALISTIHGFCQRQLQRFAFRSGLPLESSLQNSEYLRQELCQRFWLQHIASLDANDYELLGKPQFSQFMNAAKTLDFMPQLHCESKHTHANINDLIQMRKDALQWGIDLAESGQNLNDITKDKALHGSKLNWNRSYKAGWEKFCSSHRYADINFPDNFMSKDIDEFAKKNQILAEETKEMIEAYREINRRWNRVHEKDIIAPFSRWYRKERIQQLRQSEEIDFGDLLIALHSALHDNSDDNKSGKELAQDIGLDFPHVFVDEFQDTDPLQWDIIRRCFTTAQHSLYLIGDPKQSIYAFRGGDFATFVKACQSADRRYILETNYRSDANFIDALNIFFQQHDDSFASNSEIKFIPVKAVCDPSNIVDEPQKTTPALAFYNCPMHEEVLHKETSDNKETPIKLSAEERYQNIAAYCAEQIVQDLQSIHLKESEGTTRALRNEDCAVLVSSHSEAQYIKEALRSRGIQASLRGKSSVFSSQAAQSLFHLCHALLDPRDRGLNWLVSPLGAYQHNDLKRNELLEYTQFLHEKLLRTWMTFGFSTMIQEFLHHPIFTNIKDKNNSFATQILKQRDGERFLTDILHCSEVLQDEIRERQLSAAQLLDYFVYLIKHPQENAEDKERIRLERDSHALSIYTIHVSKGLEFPFIYCPFLWRNSTRVQNYITSSTDSDLGKIWYLEPNEEQKEKFTQNNFSERLRLQYVALTRAKHHCAIFIPEDNDVKFNAGTYDSPLAYYFINKEDKTDTEASLCDVIQEHISLHYSNTALCNVYRYKSLPNITMVTQQHENTAQGLEQQTTALISEFEIQATWSYASYSSLIRGLPHERPDYDALDSSESLHTNEQGNSALQKLPSGARFGTAVHSCFENVEFTRADDLNYIRRCCEPILAEHGLSTDHSVAVAYLIQNTLCSTITLSQTESAQLKNTAAKDYICELEFLLNLRKESFSALLRNSTSLPPEYRENIGELAIPHGYLTGFIDLVVFLNGKYWVLDWKSNKLAHYSQPSMAHEMAHHHYYIQAMLYQVALYRHLQQYGIDDPSELIGGALYAFIRGCRTNHNNPEIQNEGWVVIAPDTDLFKNIDSIFPLHHDNTNNITLQRELI